MLFIEKVADFTGSPESTTYSGKPGWCDLTLVYLNLVSNSLVTSGALSTTWSNFPPVTKSLQNKYTVTPTPATHADNRVRWLLVRSWAKWIIWWFKLNFRILQSPFKDGETVCEEKPAWGYILIWWWVQALASWWQVLSSAPPGLGKQLLLGSYSKVEGPGMLTDMLSEVSSIHFGMYYLPVSSFLQEKTWERWTGPASALCYWRTTGRQGLFGSWLESHFKAIAHSELYSNTEINAST